MEEYFYILIGIPIAWMIGCLAYQFTNLIYIWMQNKWVDIKNKEFHLWD